MTIALQFLPSNIILQSSYDDLLATQPLAKSSSSDDIILLTITENTLENFKYRSPLDRGFLAKVVAKLSRAKARAVGLDMLFDQRTEPEKDQLLKAALQDAKDIVTLARATRQDGLSEKQIAFQDTFTAGLNTASIVLAKSQYDGVVRHVISGRAKLDTLTPNLARAMSQTVGDVAFDEIERITYLTNSDGSPHTFKTYPIETAELLPDTWFTGKYVLIGTDITGLDQFRTPYVSRLGEAAGTLAGVAIHAHILNQHLQRDVIATLPNLVMILVLFLAAYLGMKIMMLEIPILARLTLLMVILAAILLGPYKAFPATKMLVPSVSIAFAFTLTGLMGMLLRWQQERSERQFVTAAWSRYVSSSVVDELLNDHARLETEGERRDISLIFTDIASFTELAEKTPIDRLTLILNRYLDRMSSEFLDAGATLDKFVGDAIVGFFGAPVADVNHPDKAVALALRLDQVCRELQDELLLEGVTLGKTRIGVHSGTAIVGNFGGRRFFDYTAMGDAVNTAARLEAANKNWGGTICVSGDTSRRAINHSFRPIGKLHLAGKEKLVDAWEPRSPHNDDMAPVNEYDAAYNKLEQGDHDALAFFKDLNSLYQNDHLVSFHLNRLEASEHGILIETVK